MNKVDCFQEGGHEGHTEVTDKRDCMVIGIFKMTVAANAKTAKASYDDNAAE